MKAPSPAALIDRARTLVVRMHGVERWAYALDAAVPAESVRGLGMSNPFSYALRRRPSRGGAVNISDTNVSENAIAPRERLIGDVDLLLVPDYPATARGRMAMVLRRYPEILGRDYAIVASSPHWRLYRRLR